MAEKKQAFTAVILAAGKGTRMRRVEPKVLQKVGGWSLLKHVLFACAEGEAKAVYVVVGYGRDLVCQELQDLEKTFSLALNSDLQAEQKGTGDALRHAFTALPEKDSDPILILCGDVPLFSAARIQEFLDFHRREKADLTAATTALENPSGFGRIFGEAGRITRIVEEKDASLEEKKQTLVNGGIYVAERDFLAKFLPKLKPSPASGEIYATDLVAFGAEGEAKV